MVVEDDEGGNTLGSRMVEEVDSKGKGCSSVALGGGMDYFPLWNLKEAPSMVAWEVDEDVSAAAWLGGYNESPELR